jgi:hypothetical protein
MSFAESIILATIITVTVILIENLLFKNNKRNINNINVDIPKSCNSCKINIPKKLNNIDDNILVLSENESKSLLLNENFTSVDSVDNDYEYRCYRGKKEKFDNLSTDNNDAISSSLKNIQLITPIPIQSEINYEPPTQQTMMTPPPQQTMMEPPPQQTMMTLPPPQQTMMVPPPTQQSVMVPPPPQQTMMTLPPPQQTMMEPPPTQQSVMPPQQEPITDKPVYMQARSELDTNIIMEDVQNRGGNTYDVDSVQYQQDGIQNEEDNKVFDNNIFRMSVGNRSVVNKFIESGGKYYGDILTRSTNAPSKFQAATNELKYGDFNYIAPLNKGMINPAYTFVSPTNWYPIPPHPPVCVTNKRCTTSPVIISDGKDYMNFASLEDFDASRRFTGDMGINVDYIKNVLNNADGN